MAEENTWIDFSNASSWEESVSKLEEIFSKFRIGIHSTGTFFTPRFSPFSE